MGDLLKSLLRNGSGLAALGLGILAFSWAIGTGSRILAIGGALVGVSMLMLAGLLLAPSVSELLSRPFGSIFFPETRDTRPPPQYSLAEAKVQRDDFEGAIAHYVEITLNYPDEARPYCEMIDIILRHLHDPERAELVYHRGVEALRSRDAREILERCYRAAKSRAAGLPEWGRVRKVGYRAEGRAADAYRDAPEREHVPNPHRTSRPKGKRPE